MPKDSGGKSKKETTGKFLGKVFWVVQKLSEINYKICEVGSKTQEQIVHVDRMAKFHSDGFSIEANRKILVEKGSADLEEGQIVNVKSIDVLTNTWEITDGQETKVVIPPEEYLLLKEEYAELCAAEMGVKVKNKTAGQTITKRESKKKKKAAKKNIQRLCYWFEKDLTVVL